MTSEDPERTARINDQCQAIRQRIYEVVRWLRLAGAQAQAAALQRSTDDVWDPLKLLAQLDAREPAVLNRLLPLYFDLVERRPNETGGRGIVSYFYEGALDGFAEIAQIEARRFCDRYPVGPGVAISASQLQAAEDLLARVMWRTLHLHALTPLALVLPAALNAYRKSDDWRKLGAIQAQNLRSRLPT